MHRTSLSAIPLFLVGLFTLYVGVPRAQDLSSQVLRLLERANTWTAVQTFSVDPQISTVHTGAPTSTDCDDASETGKFYWDSTNDNLYLCSGASGWRKFTSAAP